MGISFKPFARLGLTVIGAVVGGLFGNPALGAIAGSIIGNLLFPPDGPPDVSQEGSRLADLAVTSSAYGAAIFIGYGTMRTSGNMIWSLPIEEVRTETTESSGGGGKGGGGEEQEVTTITYTYFGTFAIAFAEGPADRYVKIFADQKLIYDASETGFDTIKDGFTARFYDGTETQGPDPGIVADKGADAPAYRGLCYIVFDRIPLKAYGNRIPNITAVITFSGIDQFPEKTSLELSGSPPITVDMELNGLAIDWDRGLLYGHSFTADENTGGISVYDLRTMNEVRQATAFEITGTSENIGVNALTVLPSGNLYTTAGVSANSEPIILINPDTLTEIDRFGTSGAGLGMTKDRFANINSTGKNSWISLYGYNGRQNYILCVSSVSTAAGILAESGMEYVWSSDIELDILTIADLCTTHGKIGIGVGEGWWLHGDNYGTGAKTADINIVKIAVSQSAGFDLTGGIDIDHGVTTAEFAITMAQLTAAGFPDSPANVHGVGGCAYDETDDTLIIGILGDTSSHWLLKWSQTAGILWLTNITGFVNWSATQPALFNKSRLGGGTIGFSNGGEGLMIDTASGEIIFQSSNPSEWVETMAFSGAWDSHNNSIIGGITSSGGIQRLWFDRHSGSGVTVEEIIKDVTNRVGLTNADRDTSDLTSMLIPGYIITRRQSARAVIEPLAKFYLFEGTEIDDQLSFKEKGQAPTRTITEAELAVLSPATGEFFQESRQQEIELPASLSILYADPTNDYQQNTHSAKRILLPSPTMRSQNKANLSMVASLLTDDVKQQAEKLLYSTWIERVSYRFNLPWKFLDLVPTDVINVNMDSGTAFRTRLVGGDVGLDLTMQMAGLSETAAQYNSTVVGDSGSIPQQELPGSSSTKGFILDIPLLRDQDDALRTQSGLYTFAGGFGQPGWEGANVLKSPDDVDYSSVARLTAEMTYGSCRNALPDTVQPHTTNEVDTLEVFLTTGGENMVSITQLQMLNGGNAALLFSSFPIVQVDNFEVIQFRDVVENDSGSFTLSGLIRGQRGTRVNTGLRRKGDFFMLLTAATAEHFPLAITELNTQRFYRVVGRGQLFADVETRQLTSIGRELMPYMPAHLTGDEDASANIDFAWERCTRVGADLRDGFGDVPVAEDAILYELDIYDGVTFKRTLGGGGTITTESVEYSAANVTTDFGGVPASLEVEIFQISGQVGRGLTRKETIDITPF